MRIYGPGSAKRVILPCINAKNAMETHENPSSACEGASLRDDVARRESEVSPGTDFSDDNILFGRIIDDYADYAALIEEFDARVAEAELRGRNARIEELMGRAAPAGDGLPHLNSRGAGWSAARSIFDLARDAK